MSAAMPPPADANGRHDDRTLLTTPALAPELPALNHLLTLAICVLVVTALDLAREVLIPITLSVLLSFVLAPLASLLRRLRIGRVFSVLLAVFLALAVILAIGGLIGTQVASLVGEVPQYQSTIEKKVKTIRAMTIGRLEDVPEQRRQAVHPAPSTPAAPRPNRPTPAWATGRRPRRAVPVDGPSAGPVAVRPRRAGHFPRRGAALHRRRRLHRGDLHPAAAGGFARPADPAVRLRRPAPHHGRDERRRGPAQPLFPGPARRSTPASAWSSRSACWSSACRRRCCGACSRRCCASCPISAPGSPRRCRWRWPPRSIRAGPWRSGPAACSSPSKAITGQVIEPMLYGHSTGLSPVSVVVAATFWTWLWGPIGLIMSTPLTPLPRRARPPRQAARSSWKCCSATGRR